MSVLETKEVDNLLNIWHEDGMIEFPFSHKAVPGLEHPKLISLQVIYKVFQDVIKGKDFVFKDIEVFPMKDPDYVYTECFCDLTQLDFGIKYTNRYCFLAHVLDGKILLFREYFHALIRQNFEANGF